MDAEVIVIGAGFAGLCTAIQLQRAGPVSFLILERANDVGGTWRENDYPGCACDIPSHLYSFSFERKIDWSRDYPTRAEIFAYLRDVAQKYGLRPHIRFGVELTGARYDDATATWTLDTRDGSTYRARTLVSAMGALSRPFVPAFTGLATFRGRVFHSAHWDHGYDLAGKRVAVIGTGASAIQFVPQIAPIVRSLSLFARTPPWILPKPDAAIPQRKRALLRFMPFYAWVNRKVLYWIHEVRALGFVTQPRMLRAAESLALAYLRWHIKDPALRAALTPNYRMGCKRILLSNDFYPALRRENVVVVTSEIAEIREDVIVTQDRREHPVDAIILGTGFRASEAMGSVRVYGCNGLALDDVWKDGAHAYLGMSVSGFPNFYMMVGPNTGLGHNSMVYMIESQARYIRKAIVLLRRRKLSALDVRPSVAAGFNRHLQKRMARTVWKSGCRSWYLDSNGKNTTLWPGFSFVYGLRTRRFRARRYRAIR